MSQAFNPAESTDLLSEAINKSMLLHPARHFRTPADVLAASHLSSDAKRAILASWASDMYAVESRPPLRVVPGIPTPIRYEDVLSALKTLDMADRPSQH